MCNICRLVMECLCCQESSLMNLIAYRVRHIMPIQHDWLQSLSDVVEKYFVYVQLSCLYLMAWSTIFMFILLSLK